MKPTKRKKNLKTFPAFKSEEEERDFWAREDSTEYIDWTTAERVVFSEPQTLRANDFTAPASHDDCALEAAGSQA